MIVRHLTLIDTDLALLQTSAGKPMSRRRVADPHDRRSISSCEGRWLRRRPDLPRRSYQPLRRLHDGGGRDSRNVPPSRQRSCSSPDRPHLPLLFPVASVQLTAEANPRFYRSRVSAAILLRKVGVIAGKRVPFSAAKLFVETGDMAVVAGTIERARHARGSAPGH